MGPDLGKLLVIIGLLVAAVGLYVILGGKLPPLDRLPGDIHIQRENFSFYFPLGTCLLISVVLTFLVWLFRR